MTWHFTVTSEMRQLGLKGNELLVFAVIAGYSANGQGCYYGGIGYLAMLCDLNPRSIIRILKKLEGMGIIGKEEVRARGVHRVSYFDNRCVKNVTSNEGIEVTKCANRSDILCSAPIDNINNIYKYPPVVDKSTTTPQGVSRPKFSKIEQMFLACGAKEEDLRDWKTARKGAPITEAVFNGMEREARKANIDIAQAVRICAENSWRGFRAAYLEGKKGSTTQQGGRTYMGDIKATYAKLQERWARVGGQQQ